MKLEWALPWRRYRDAQCDAEEQQYEGGTIASSIRPSCVKESSNRRREEWQKSHAINLQP
ncbi:MAG TPA: lysozyme inhibitor LprI family protein [Candidatus Angelobacter sp.]